MQVDLRYRTTFYTALGRLLIVELGENDDKLNTFMSPIAGILLGYMILTIAYS